jgi:hypothetical protein
MTTVQLSVPSDNHGDGDSLHDFGEMLTLLEPETFDQATVPVGE